MILRVLGETDAHYRARAAMVRARHPELDQVTEAPAPVRVSWIRAFVENFLAEWRGEDRGQRGSVQLRR